MELRLDLEEGILFVGGGHHREYVGGLGALRGGGLAFYFVCEGDVVQG